MEGGRSVGASGAQPLRTRLHRLYCSELLVIVLLTSPGCSGVSHWIHNGFRVGPNYCPPPAPLAEEWLEQDEKSVVAAPPEDFAWWGVFNDPTLTGLIETSYE